MSQNLTPIAALSMLAACSALGCGTQPHPEAPRETSKRVSALFGCDYSDSNQPRDGQDLAWDEPDVAIAGPVTDCQGGTLVGNILVRDDGARIKNCRIEGSLRINPPGMPNANFVDPAWSHQAQGYVAGIREAAPTHVIVSDTTIVGTRVNGVCQTPLFIGPGVNWSQFVRVEISGCSDSVMVYLDAESTRNKFVDISIDARGASREAMAVDASSHNTFKRMTIVHELGGMFFYRNSGEAGVTRVTTPSFNLGEHMVFRGGANGLNGKDAYPSLWFSSRNGDRCYSPDDDGYAVGSSKSGGLGSNMDHSRGNVFVNALDIGPGGWVRDDGYGNAY